MFCPNCGTNNPDNALRCADCGTPLNAQQSQPASAPEQDPPADFKDYQVKNIILTVISFLCCGGGIFTFINILFDIVGIVTGILGIVFSSQAKSAFASGDYALAQAKAKTAKIMSNIALAMVIVGVVSVLVTVIVLIALYGVGFLAILSDELMMLAR